MPTPAQTQHFRSSLIAIQLAEGASEPVPKKVQVLKVGTFFDKRYGTFEITPEMLVSMKDNYDRNVRKLSLAFDYEHESDGVAAGWWQGVKLENNAQELWADVEWTPSGQKRLADREYRYVSADFAINYIDNETLKDHGPTLLGAALTNRPVIKGMDPITLTEGEGTMDPKDQMIASLQAEIAKLKQQIGGVPGDMPAQMAAVQHQYAEAKKELTEVSVKLSEQTKEIETLKAEKTKIEEEKKLSEKKAEFETLMKDGKAVKAQEAAFLKGDMAEFIKLAEKPNLQAAGNSGQQGPAIEPKDKAEAEAEVMKLSDAKMKADKSLTPAAAISLVLSENPKLNDKLYGAPRA